MLKSERCITLSSIVRWASGKKHCIINNKKSITFIVITFWDIKLLHFEVLSQVVRWWCHHLRTHSRSKQQHVISQSLWLQYMRICVLYSYFVSFLKVVLVPLWALHLIWHSTKSILGEHHPWTHMYSLLFLRTISRTAVVHFRTFHVSEARGFFKSQLLHLQIHHFDVIIFNFPSSLISTSKHSRDLEILNILLTIRKKEQGSSNEFTSRIW